MGGEYFEGEVRWEDKGSASYVKDIVIIFIYIKIYGN